ncbi:nuclease-related domain-containing protein [Curtobacterium sp. PhB136]|uniref:nuclease-related domain-containing protein n=1 Tax=Curtobacterium sp. PhB136 TaxID=2485181 RepID=UPI0010540D4D|nr:nuclease-related domain-containing protein [Curtobacterium sp. PhB136]TCK63111.1 nuclease-like protein [Curtobacterium sp. PhB136]
MQQCLVIQADGPPRSGWARFWGRHPLRPEAESWFKGAQGERQVAAQLDMLGSEYTVLHAVPVGAGDGDIDHVVVGPTGVFSINTKNHADRSVWVGGHTLVISGRKLPHVQKSLKEGAKASQLLSAAAGGPIRVQPLLVIESARLKFGDKVPAVPVLRPHEVARHVNSQPRVHSDAAVRYLSMLAEERGTWHVDAVVINDTLRHVQRFERLEREITAAARQRRFMRKAVAVAILAVPAGALLGYWWAVAVSSIQQ